MMHARGMDSTMKTTKSLLALWLIALTPLARARDYPLQFTPPAGYQGLVVAGYEFVGKTVVGNCSYYTVPSGSGRAGGYHPSTKSYQQTCTWDLYGKLLSVKPGAPAVPAPLSTKGPRTVYAANTNGAYTGSDSKLREEADLSARPVRTTAGSPRMPTPSCRNGCRRIAPH
jgi:hypothetical protein